MYDPSSIHVLNYVYSGDADLGDGLDSCRKYSSQKGDMGVTFSNDPSKSSQATSTLNIGTGYNIGLAMSLAGCSSCASENIEYLTVDGHAYSSYVAPDNDY